MLRRGCQEPTFERLGAWSSSRGKDAIEMFEAYGRRYYGSQKHEMELLADALVCGKDISASDDTAKHLEWLRSFEKNYTFTKENAIDILHMEIGKTFVRVLEDAGVYKRTKEGKNAFLRFMHSVGASEK